MNDIAISSWSKYFKICILTLIFTFCSVTLKAQTGKPFIFHGSKSNPGMISSATNLSDGKLAYTIAGDWSFTINIEDTNGNQLLSRIFSGADLNNVFIKYNKGYIYGVTTSYIDGDSTQRKASLVFFKLDMCLNLVASKLVYNRNPDADLNMYIQPNVVNNIGMNDKDEFLISITNILKPNTESQYRNILVIFDTLLNIRFSPYYYAFETSHCDFKNKRYQLTGCYYQLSIDSSSASFKPFYSEIDPVTEELNMWVLDRYNVTNFGYLSSVFYPEKSKMYASIKGMGLGPDYSHGVLDYQNLDAANYTVLSDTVRRNCSERIIRDWPSSNKFAVIEESLEMPLMNLHGQSKMRSFSENLNQLAERKIYGWGNLNNGLDDTFSMWPIGTLAITSNKLLVFGSIKDDFSMMTPFYYVIDSQLNFAKKKIDTSIYHCGRTRILPAAVIVTKDTFFLTNDMFKEAKMTIHNIKLGKINYTASLLFEKPLELKKSNRLLIKYLPNNNVTCNLLGANSSFQYKVYDMSGKLVYSGNSYDNTVTLKQSDYISGVYILSITKNNEHYSEKIQIR